MIISFRAAVAVWWRIGWLSFGGPAGQIALMHRLLVEEKGWIDERRFLQALNYCMLLPGPEAQQLATYIGWLLHGVRGGVVAGVLFILPGAAVMLALSFAYVLLGGLPLVDGLLLGVKAAVLAIVVQALLRLGRRALEGWRDVLLALGGFVALYAFAVPFPWLVIGAGAIGFVGTRDRVAADTPVPDTLRRPGTLVAALVCLVLWLGTVGGLQVALGGDHVLSRIAVFFSTVAMVTFGGAYSVLSYIAQQAVETYGWLAPGEMLDGLGLAETTPGPLILVTQFVGFLAAQRAHGGDHALIAGVAGAVLTTWVLFLPSFLWIFAGAPHVERLLHRPRLAGALTAITAAVLGVIANLALWFAVHLLFARSLRVDDFGLALLLPEPSSLHPQVLALSVLALVLTFALRLGVLPVLGLCAVAGVALAWVS
ncbi:MAG: chromate efflux transporter [Porticoccaceae bacterium]